jgi:hypothetical protein
VLERIFSKKDMISFFELFRPKDESDSEISPTVLLPLHSLRTAAPFLLTTIQSGTLGFRKSICPFFSILTTLFGSLSFCWSKGNILTFKEAFVEYEMDRIY